MLRHTRLARRAAKRPGHLSPSSLAFRAHRRYLRGQSEIEDWTAPVPWDRAAAPCLDFAAFNKSELNSVAKTTPIEFIRQVQAETRKVVWPTRRETIMTGVMVMIMTTLLAVFFFGIDTIFEAIVKMLLSLAN